MSKLETNTIDNISGSSTLTIGDSNASTISIPKNITLGASGTTITVPSGATITNNGTQTGFGITGLGVANSWYVSSDTSASSNTETKLTSFATQTTGTGNVFSNSSGTFTAPSTGIYLVIASFACYTSGSTFAPYIVSRIKKGGSVRSTSQNAIYSESSGNRWSQLVTTGIIDITNTSSDTLTFHFQPANTSANIENGNTSQVQFIKLAET